MKEFQSLYMLAPGSPLIQITYAYPVYLEKLSYIICSKITFKYNFIYQYSQTLKINTKYRHLINLNGYFNNHRMLKTMFATRIISIFDSQYNSITLSWLPRTDENDSNIFPWQINSNTDPLKGFVTASDLENN